MTKLTVSRKWYEAQNQENKKWFAILAPKNGVQETKQFINLCVKCGVTPRSQVKLQAIDVHGNLYEVNQETKKIKNSGCNMKTPEYQKRASKAYEARQNEKGLFKKYFRVTLEEYEAIKLLLEKLRCNNKEKFKTKEKAFEVWDGLQISRLIKATIRDGIDWIDLECRFENGEKYVAVRVDTERPELARKICDFLNKEDK